MLFGALCEYGEISLLSLLYPFSRKKESGSSGSHLYSKLCVALKLL